MNRVTPLMREMALLELEKQARAGESNTNAARGFKPHTLENRHQRLKATATWVPPEGTDMPTRRELFEQRQRRAFGIMDPDLNRLRRAMLRAKGKAK